ncbi:8-oxo-dGTP diphosphatase [Catenulispora sp. GP43]|uniref:NUDIX domain-containing protein n=1 Tax=Catenulispora sp. GP43 TaxID=3156263 RepID=UPI003516AE00
MDTNTPETTPETARLTADVVLLSLDTNGIWRVLVIRRGHAPYAGHWALPGGHVDGGEQTHMAAFRELREETGIEAPGLTYVGVYAAPDRDPRGRYVDFAYTQIVDGMPAPAAGDDATEARWMPVADALDPAAQIAFDHERIIVDALHTLRLSSTGLRHTQ